MRILLLHAGLWLGSTRLVRWLAARLGITSQEREGLAAREAARRRLKTLHNLRCPLCDTEIENAWSHTSDGRLEVRQACVCPTCDFRLDACRHCLHFIPGGASGSGGFTSGFGPAGVRLADDDFTQGGCGVYRAYVSVYDLYDEKTADRLAMFTERIRVPKPIADSYIPLPECTAFALAPQRLRHSGARLDRRWRGWLRWIIEEGA